MMADHPDAELGTQHVPIASTSAVAYSGNSSTSPTSTQISAPEPGMVPKKRTFRRGQRACDACSKRKMRCDQAVPTCTPCASKDLHCEYTRPQAKRGRRATVIASLRNGQSASMLEEDAEPFSFASSSSNLATTTTRLTVPTSTTHASAHLAAEQSISEDAGIRRNLAHASGTPSTTFSEVLLHPDESRLNELGNTNTASDPAQAHFDGSSPATQILSSLETTIGWSAALELIDLYFTHLWPMLPIIHQPTFMQALYERQDRTSESFCMLALNACAAAAVSSRSMPMPPAVAVLGLSWLAIAGRLNACIRRGAQWIQTMSRTDSCACLQNVILVAYLERSIGSPVADRLINEAERIAQAFHFGRDFPSLDDGEAKLRRRAFWHLYRLDKLRAFLHGQSMSLRADELDIDTSLGPLQAHLSEFLRDGGEVLEPFAQHVLLSRVAEDVLLRWRGDCRIVKDPQSKREIKNGLNMSVQQLMDCAAPNARSLKLLHPSSPKLSLLVTRACFIVETYSRYSVLLLEERSGLLSNMSNVAARLAADLSSVPIRLLQGLDTLTVSLLELAHRRLAASIQYLDDPFARYNATDCASQLEEFARSARAGKDYSQMQMHADRQQQDAYANQPHGGDVTIPRAFENAGLPSESLLPDHFFDTPLPIAQPGTGTIDLLGDLSTSIFLPSEWSSFFDMPAVGLQ